MPNPLVMPRWADRLPLLLVGAAVLAGAGATWSARAGAPAAVEQPIAFSHAVHAGELALDCAYCHAGVAARAGIPPTATCLGCHAEVGPDGADIVAVRKSGETGTPIAWVRVQALAWGTAFAHDRHAEIPCARCHGDVAQMTTTTAARPFAMGECVACHRTVPPPTLAPLHCSGCHE